MGKTYVKMTEDQLIDYIRKFEWTRVITQTHMHHTYLPNHSQFNGKNHDELNFGMETYHKSIKYSDIAQHVTSFPDGMFLIGRGFNVTPASILGWNTGAFCIETVGDFDSGNDKFEGAQADAIYKLCEFMVEEKKTVLKFHRDSPTAYKTCPGSGIDRADFFDKVANYTENKEKEKVEELKRIMSKVRVLFRDMMDETTGKPHWANDFVNFIADRKIAKGYVNEDGSFSFKPDAPITRAEVATLLAKTIESIEESIKAISVK